MTNVITFPCDNFEDLSLTERALLIEEWSEEINENLERIRQAADAIKALIEARKQ